ncbi:MHS family MFS transporter [Salinibacterium sp. dk2585]|uniref:MFS transporter n=1 Tax=unclassified Salinibacterium TaxID=2632331 RepID=UPI0011C25784|nr:MULTISPECIES: MFS transporter [unclassified Salinibacterium]QEE61971.1 MHS family MFS transporter [Salinibacterium sp. dk2585]TXK54474.1 MHS family MFS transporter [Salinibacterium sp. dk5596]
MTQNIDVQTTPASSAPGLRSPQMRRILASSFIGSTIEFYDFLIYVTASAVVFSRLFFTDLNPVTATIASFGTLAVGYLARPIGGIIFGHLGDRIGRKKVLIASMLLMGGATVLIGVLPTTDQVGQMAVVMLVALRIIQGIAVGGEWGGAVLIALETAHPDRRGFAGAFANFGAPLGSVLAAGAFSIVSLLPDEQFFSWGWRLPFLLSAVLVIVALFIRLRVAETPLFKELKSRAAAPRVPLLEILRRHRLAVLIGLAAVVSHHTISGLANAWAVSHSVSLGVEQASILGAKSATSIGMLLAAIVTAFLCDRIGRKPIIIGGILAAMLWAVPMMMLVDTGTLGGFVAGVGVAEVIQGAILGPLAAYTSELFPTAVRYTGASLCFQLSSTIGAGLFPLAVTSFLAATGGNIYIVGAAWVAFLLLCLLAVMSAKDGRGRDLNHIDPALHG